LEAAQRVRAAGHHLSGGYDDALRWAKQLEDPALAASRRTLLTNL
jgi:hypothetical protein